MDSIRDYLFYGFTEPIRDPVWQNIYLSSGIKAITQSRQFQQLSRIKQLGPAYHVYPGATHTRLNHSLGVFHIAKRIITRLYMQDTAPPLTLEGIKSFFVAALLHDIGHFPYAHSLKELPLKEHEVLTAEIVLDSHLTQVIREQAKADPYAVASIVDEKLKPADSFETPFYRRLLSGVLDPDKLDYLNRDAFFCGVPYGIQDTDFYLDKILYNDARLVLEEAGITAIENILFSKYLMYKTVYWHRTVRIATAMIKKAVSLGMSEGYLKPEQLYGLDDDDFHKTVHVPECRALGLIDMVFTRNFYKIIYETNFDKVAHSSFLELNNRFTMEELLSRELSRKTGLEWGPEEVVMDIPEPVSFEVDLDVVINGNLMSFRSVDSGFSPEVVTNFTHTLRKLRIFISKKKIDSLSRNTVNNVIHDFLETCKLTGEKD